VKKRTSIWVIIVAIALLTAVARLVQVTLGSVGGGRSADSPDKKFRASASSFRCERFWGGVHNYYEFSVNSADGRRIQHILMDEPPQGMVGWREDGSIQWTLDSSSPTYSFKGTELKLSVKP
jgi:hypothetical protein